ncbi:MAG: alkaline phosphatase family protein [Verrucomicrobia subdivision 3 bacterium]|nr:alkaline phosphatase family protein [Limisphaerales bacterium]
MLFIFAHHIHAAEAPYLLLGPMIGHVSDTEARIWAKASGAARLSVLIGSQEDLSDGNLIKGPPLVESAGFMTNVWIGGLKPASRYYYCIFLDGKPAMLRPYPSFITGPPAAQAVRVRCAFTSCVGFRESDSAAGWADIATRTNIDLVLLLGDNHYANTSDPVKQRSFYHEMRNAAGYRELTSRIPTYGIWDDHDYGPDNSDATLKGKEHSLQVFREHWANPSYGEADNPGVYFKFTRGSIDFFMLDVRYYRDPNVATNLPHKTMLGDRQLAWLKQGLLASKAPVKILASGSEWQTNGTADSWKSFARERDDLFGFIESNRIEGIVFFSGDRHFTAAYQVKGKWLEVSSGPIGSSNAEAKLHSEMWTRHDKGKFYCVLDIDTRAQPPSLALEIYRAAEGLVERKAFTWNDILGRAKIKSDPPPEKKAAAGAKKPSGEPKTNSPPVANPAPKE